MSIVKIEIETAIRDLSWGSFQAGQKSLHTVLVDLTNQKIESSYKTGHTEILGFSVNSIRDGFKIENKQFLSKSVIFKAIGQTASAVGFMPNINYTFYFHVTESQVLYSGSHDGYPSYKISVNGKPIYDHMQGWLGELFGDADIDVPTTTHNIP